MKKGSTTGRESCMSLRDFKPGEEQLQDGVTEHFGDRESKSFSENIGSEKKKEVHGVKEKRELRKDLHLSQVSGKQGN